MTESGHSGFQLYDVFPEPPPGHPLFDAEAQKKLQQYRELASSLHQWIRENIVIMQVRSTCWKNEIWTTCLPCGTRMKFEPHAFLFLQDRNFPNTLIEMKRLAEKSQRFRVEDVPPRLNEKERVTASFRWINNHVDYLNFINTCRPHVNILFGISGILNANWGTPVNPWTGISIRNPWRGIGISWWTSTKRGTNSSKMRSPDWKNSKGEKPRVKKMPLDMW